MKSWIVRAAAAVLLAFLIFLGLRLATRSGPVGSEAMALAAYANADALADFLLTGGEHDK
jgi:hypothetical protein